MTAKHPLTPPRGEPMPQTREHWEKRAAYDQELILEMKAEISKLKHKLNQAMQRGDGRPVATKDEIDDPGRVTVNNSGKEGNWIAFKDIDEATFEHKDIVSNNRRVPFSVIVQ